MDKILLDHQRLATPLRCHPLQFGFTAGKSGLHAAFLVTEAISEAKDKGEILYAASLDVQKAFDTVQHKSLLDKLHALGMNGIWWRIKKDTYDGQTSRISWEGVKSENPFQILQGNGQGKLTSPDDYITFLRDLMDILTKSGAGYYIGDTCVSIPTCADDMVALASNSQDLQTLISLIEYYANSENYKIHPVKSEIVPFNIKNRDLNNTIENNPFSLNDSKIPIKSETTQLGIKRNHSSPSPTIEDRIKTARRSLYSLMGTGLHGTNGLPVGICTHLYEIYILPRALYGTEAIVLSTDDISKLEKFQRYTLRCILGLPERTAIAGIYILTGALPMEQQHEIRTLCFFHALLQEETTRAVVIRQYIMKAKKSASWVVQAERMLESTTSPPSRSSSWRYHLN